MRSSIITAILLLTIRFANAQSKLTKENIQKDTTIKADIIDPAVREAQGEAPDWSGLTADITKKYDVTYADRNITKTRSFFASAKTGQPLLQLLSNTQKNTNQKKFKAIE